MRNLQISNKFFRNVQLSQIVLLLIFCSSIYAELDRPNIANLLPQKISKEEAPNNWETTKLALLRFATEISGLYSGEHIYIIGRDGEYVYDLLQSLHKGDIEFLSKLHLFNISRDNILSNNFKAYLVQEGLTLEKIGDSQVVLIDTGFVGTVPIAIRESLPVNLQQKIHPHFLLSASPTVPSSLFALSTYDSSGQVKDVTTLRPHVNHIEHLPHFNGKSSDYRLNSKNVLEPIASDSTQSDKEKVRILMQDIKHFAEDNKVQEFYNKNRKHIRIIRSALLGELEATHPDVLQSVHDLESSGLLTPLIIDFNDLSLKHRLKITDSNLEKFVHAFPKLSSLFHSPERAAQRQLVLTHPDVSEFLVNPWETIPKLDLVKDKNILLRLIELGSEETLSIICSELLSKSGAEKNTKILELMLEKVASHKWVIASVLNKPYWQKSPEIFGLTKKLIERGSSDRRVVDSILSSQTMASDNRSLELLEMIIKRAKAKENLNNNLFSKPWWSEHSSLKQLLVDKPVTLPNLIEIISNGSSLIPSAANCTDVYNKVGSP